MRVCELRERLKALGFIIEKTTKHQHWVCGSLRVVLPKGSKIGPKHMKVVNMILRRLEK